MRFAYCSVLVFAIGGLACRSQSLGGGSRGAARDSTSGADRPLDAFAGDADGATVGSDAGDGGAACPALDVAMQCPGGTGSSGKATECQATWSAVLANPFCVPQPRYLRLRDQRRDCGPYHVRSVYHYATIEGAWPDPGILTYYYDAGTGALVAIYGRDSGNDVDDTKCVATDVTVEADCLPQARSDGSTEGADVCAVDAATTN